MLSSGATKALIARLADGRFQSGQSLAESLALSRTAVWGLIQNLESLGLEIHAVRGKGYRLAYPLELLDAAIIESELSPGARRQLAVLEILDEIDSTSSRLMRLEPGARTSGYACVAEYQTAGRGRIGRVWQSPFGGNICLSLLWQFQDQRAVAGLSLAVGVAVVRALTAVGVAGVGLKWPNDVLWQGRKLGGILLEVSGEANGVYNIVIGVGINVALTATDANVIDQPWVDLRHIMAGTLVPRNRLVARILDELFSLLEAHQRGGLAEHIDEWRTYHCHQGKPARLHQGDREIAGIVVGVTDEGLLLLDTETDGRMAFASGDLRLRVDGG